jgi:ribosomal protein S5
MAYATLKALKSQRTVEQIAALRGKKVEDLV